MGTLIQCYATQLGEYSANFNRSVDFVYYFSEEWASPEMMYDAYENATSYMIDDPVVSGDYETVYQYSPFALGGRCQCSVCFLER